MNETKSDAVISMNPVEITKIISKHKENYPQVVSYTRNAGLTEIIVHIPEQPYLEPRLAKLSEINKNLEETNKNLEEKIKILEEKIKEYSIRNEEILRMLEQLNGYVRVCNKNLMKLNKKGNIPDFLLQYAP